MSQKEAPLIGRFKALVAPVGGLHEVDPSREVDTAESAPIVRR